jgi:hypothetical protein
MPTAIRFAGTCPTCGRHLHIPIDLHGKWVRCHGCGAEFLAIGRRELSQQESTPQESALASAEPKEAGKGLQGASGLRSSLDFRVDSLLAAADRQLHQACMHHSR